MRELKLYQLLNPTSCHERPVDPGTLLRAHRTDGYEPGYARGTQAATQFVVSLRFRRTAGQIIVPSELGRVIERTMIRWEAAGGRGMSIQPVADRSAGFETVCGEMHGFSAELMEHL